MMRVCSDGYWRICCKFGAAAVRDVELSIGFADYWIPLDTLKDGQLGHSRIFIYTRNPCVGFET